MRLFLDDKATSVVKEICEVIRQEGGRAFLVGGLVRNRLITQLLTSAPSEEVVRDFDLEVYGIEADRLKALIQRFGRVNEVGESFSVYKLAVRKGGERIEVDVSLPRSESKVGRGHRGFRVQGDPRMSYTEAARRRDFTINAIMCDPLNGELIDPYGGIGDIQRRLLRMVDPKTFIEDSLRVLRGMVFAARFEFKLEAETVALCRNIVLDDLPCERIWMEMEKLLLRSRRPSLGLTAGLEMGVIEKLFPELAALVGCEQEAEWHPEGDVWTHTLQALDVAAKIARSLPKPKRLTVMLAVLCHDLGKPSTTKYENGRIRSRGHEEAGIEPTHRFLDRFNLHKIDRYKLRKQVVALVANHLKPCQFFYNRDRVTDGVFRRLASKCDMELLYLVATADALGRVADGVPLPTAEAPEWFWERARWLGVEHEPPSPILLGRHLIDLGLVPGKRMGEITSAVYEMQLDGKVTTLEEALAAAHQLLTA